MFEQKITWYFVSFLRNVEYVYRGTAGSAPRYFNKLKSLHCIFFTYLSISVTRGIAL